MLAVPVFIVVVKCHASVQNCRSCQKTDRVNRVLNQFPLGKCCEKLLTQNFNAHTREKVDAVVLNSHSELFIGEVVVKSDGSHWRGTAKCLQAGMLVSAHNF